MFVRTLVALSFISAVVLAQEPTLAVGDKAPPIEISHWVKGEPVKEFEPGNVYVVEFWATWCAPCIGSMPHVSELQAKYGDKVTFIGVSSEPLATVVKWLAKTDPQTGKPFYERPRYRLTTDPDKSVQGAYFTAAGQRGIPCAFIVGKDTRVEWVGHPMSMDEPLARIVAGNWDREKWKVDSARAEAARRAYAAAMAPYNAAVRAKQWEAALKALDEVIGKYPAYELNLSLQRFYLLLKQLNRPQDAYALGETLVRDQWQNAELLNQIAWTVVDDQAVQTRDLGFALRVAARANKLTDSKDPAILDTLARVHYEKGDLRAAIAWQRKAVEHADKNKMGEQIRAVLNKYQAEYQAKAAPEKPRVQEM